VVIRVMEISLLSSSWVKSHLSELSFKVVAMYYLALGAFILSIV